MLGFSDRQTGRNSIARVTGNACDIGIIQVEIADGSVIGEGRKIGCDAALGPDDGRTALAVRQYHVSANAHGFLVEGGEGATERVDDVRLNPFNRFGV